ncbi:unnamed protein product, partial [Ectocarpus fasciculatus]
TGRRRYPATSCCTAVCIVRLKYAYLKSLIDNGEGEGKQCNSTRTLSPSNPKPARVRASRCLHMGRGRCFLSKGVIDQWSLINVQYDEVLQRTNTQKFHTPFGESPHETVLPMAISGNGNTRK